MHGFGHRVGHDGGLLTSEILSCFAKKKKNVKNVILVQKNVFVLNLGHAWVWGWT